MTHEIGGDLKVPYALRRVPVGDFGRVLPLSASPQPGDIALARVEKIGKNNRLELSNGRPSTLYEGDLLAVVFGNRYATQQFEGYAGARNASCDMLSMGGLCGLVESKHAGMPDPTRLRLLGAIGDRHGMPLHLRHYRLPKIRCVQRPKTIVVCGTSMDAGKTYTASSLIVGLRRLGKRVAAVKLTGTAAGKDTWNLRDAGTCAAFDFVDGGYPSTYLCSLNELLELHELLTGHAARRGAGWLVVEIADGVLQEETAALLASDRFKDTINAWVFATSDPLAAAGGMRVLRDHDIEPAAISGLISQSPLAMREARVATGVACMTANELQRGELNARLIAGRRASDPEAEDDLPAAQEARLA